MRNSIIGLKICDTVSLAKSISIIRKYNPIPMSEIKCQILTNKYVLVYPRIDDQGLKKVINCYKDLTNAGLKAELYEGNDEPTTIELLQNLDRTYDEISDEIDNDEL
jgi:hypothetical protein